MQGKPLRQLHRTFLNSSSVATKNTFVLDLMGAMGAGSGLISLLLYQLTGDLRFDAIGAMLVGGTTAILALVLIIGVEGFLVGKRASAEVEEHIKKAALTIPQVKQILDLRTMQIGSEKLLVNMEVHMEDELTTDQLELLIDKIKAQVQTKVPSIQFVQVELETPE